jgi:hypothetical protein
VTNPPLTTNPQSRLVDVHRLTSWISSNEQHWAAMIRRRARPLRELREELKTRLEAFGLLEIEAPAGLRTPREAARKLRCSIKTLNGHIASGALRYVNVGHGRKRVRRMFADVDLDEFIANQSRKDVPCPSTRTETAARRISTTTSKCEVIGFTARRNARRAAKPKK